MSAAPGDPDPTFGEAGAALAPVFPGETRLSMQGLAMLPDGKILVVGQSTAYDELAVARFTADGVLDAGFGNGGAVRTPLWYDYCLENFWAGLKVSVARQEDGRIVVGSSVIGGWGLYEDVLVARYHPEGALDTGFGQDGFTTTDVCMRGWIWGQARMGRDLAVRADGTILVPGMRQSPSLSPIGEILTPTLTMELWRFSPLGQPLPLVAAGGPDDLPDSPKSALRVADHFPPPVFVSAGSGLALQPDGSAIVVGAVAAGAGRDLAVWRLRPEGALDPTFGSGGYVTMNLATDPVLGDSDDHGNAVALQPDGKIVVVGLAAYAYRPYREHIIRLTSDGALDPTFGAGGVIMRALPPRSDGYRTYDPDVTVQADGKLIVANLELARYNTDGTRDATFGGGGVVTPTATVMLYEIALQPDGKILAVDGDRLMRFQAALDGAAEVPADGTAAIGETGVTIANRGAETCTFQATKHPVAPGGGLPDPGELPIHWHLTSDCADLNIDLTLCYTEDELYFANQVAEAELTLARQAPNGAWVEQGGEVDVTANCVTKRGVTALSNWTVRNASGIPTAVELAYFTAEFDGRAIVLQWETIAADATLGYNLWRAKAAAGPWLQLNQDLIAGGQAGGGAGFGYIWRDELVQPGATYWYRLEAVDGSGEARSVGSLTATARRMARGRCWLPVMFRQ